MPTREAIVEALLTCVTREEAEAALADARAYMAKHSDDLDLFHMMEAARDDAGRLGPVPGGMAPG